MVAEIALIAALCIPTRIALRCEAKSTETARKNCLTELVKKCINTGQLPERKLVAKETK